MLGLLKSKNSYAASSKSVYAAILSHIRQPALYETLGVPDSFDGRFDLLLLHSFLVIDYMLQESPDDADKFNQALFDSIFADMDQTLREMGIGDVGVPKHMRKMMKAFNGRMHAYEKATKDETMTQALAQNLYGTMADVSDETIESMMGYIAMTQKTLSDKNSMTNILNGQIEL